MPNMTVYPKCMTLASFVSSKFKVTYYTQKKDDKEFKSKKYTYDRKAS